MTDIDRKSSSLCLSSRLLLLCGLILICCIGSAAVTLQTVREQRGSAARLDLAGRQRMLTQKYAKEVLDGEIQKQLLASGRALAKSVSTQIANDRAYYTKNVIGKLKREMPDFKASASYHLETGAIPLPATYVREVAELNNATDDYQFELLSKWPVNRSKGLRNAIERRAWDALEQQPDKPYQEIVREGAGAKMYYFTSDVASAAACVSCHNQLPESPKKDFVLNDLMGMLMVSVAVTDDQGLAEALIAQDKGTGPAAGEKTRQLFEATLVALRDGGITHTDLAMSQPIELGPEEKPEIRRQLDEVQQKWDAVQASVQVIESSELNSDEYVKQVAAFRAASIDCLKAMHGAVGLLKAESDFRVTRMTAVQYLAVAISLLLFAVVLIYIRAKIVRPLKDALGLAKAVARGDLTKSCPVVTSDEVGQLSESLNTMCSDIRQLVNEIYGSTTTLTGASTQLAETASGLTEGANQTCKRSATVASAAEQLSNNVGNMNRSTDQVSQSVGAVSKAIENVTASIGEISQNAEQSAAVVANATDLVDNSHATVGKLGDAADEIGKVIETIQDIAEQTNLLALNATIEAARAGDAGKGFAVVATEVKELAKQTAHATEDIRSRIEGIQESTQLAVDTIAQISEVFGQVNEVSRSIAAAVEEQSITTKEIARNISETTDVVMTVSTAVAESASATQEIAHNITNVDRAAREAASGAEETQVASSDLSNLSLEIQSLIGKFKV